MAMLRSTFASLLKVKLPSREVGLLFKHRRFDKPTFDSETCKHFLNGITYCEVYRITGNGDATIIVCGRGLCKFPDPYNKKIGRKRALTSAMNKVAVITKARLFTKEERELIWTAYWERTNPDKTPLHPYGPVPANASELITQDGTIIGAE